MRTSSCSFRCVPLLVAVAILGSVSLAAGTWTQGHPSRDHTDVDTLRAGEEHETRARHIRIDDGKIVFDSETILEIEDIADQVEEALERAEEAMEEAQEQRYFGKKVRRWDVVRFGEDVFVSEDEYVSGDAVSVFGNVIIEGHVSGDVVAVFGDVSLAGSAMVNGEAVSVFGRVIEAPGSRVRGQTLSVGLGTIGGRAFGGCCPTMGPSWLMIISLFGMGVLLVLSLLLMLIFRQGTLRIAGAIRRDFLKSWLVGLLTEVILVVISVILVVTVIGLPIAIVMWTVMGIAFVWAFAGISLRVGEAVSGRAEGTGSAAGALLLGGLVILAVSVLSRILGIGGAVIPAMGIWFVGGVITWFALATGLGSVVLTRFGTRDYPAHPAPMSTTSTTPPPPPVEGAGAAPA